MKRFKIQIPDVDLNHLQSNSQAGQDLFVVAMSQGKKNGIFLEIGANHCKIENNTYLLEKTFQWSGWSIDLKNCHNGTNYAALVKDHWTKFYSSVKDDSWPQSPGSLHDLPQHIQNELIYLHGYLHFKPEDLDWKTDRPLTKFIQHDALELDYNFLTDKIDYLQVDIDPPSANYRVLEQVIRKAKFAAITFEHDLWRGTDQAKQARTRSRILLQDHGYEIVANDVTIEPGRGQGIDDEPIYFEDWYAHPDLVPWSLIENYRTLTQDLRPKYYDEILFDTGKSLISKPVNKTLCS